MRARSEEHTSELQSHSGISYAVFCLKKKKRDYRIHVHVIFICLNNEETYKIFSFLLNVHFFLFNLLLTIIYSCFFFFNDTATTEIYTPLYTLSLHDALPISAAEQRLCRSLSRCAVRSVA